MPVRVSVQAALLDDYEGYVERTFFGLAKDEMATRDGFVDDGRNLNVAPLFHFVNCRGVLRNIIKAVDMMNEAFYSSGKISVLIADSKRLNVARLIPIECAKIAELDGLFEECLQTVMSLGVSTWEQNLHNHVPKVDEQCREMLRYLGIPFNTWDSCNIWRLTVHVLDMAVFSYMGAHIELFGFDRNDSIRLPRAQFQDSGLFGMQRTPISDKQVQAPGVAPTPVNRVSGAKTECHKILF